MYRGTNFRKRRFESMKNKRDNTCSVIPRAPTESRTICREKPPVNPVREVNEVQAAYAQVGQTPNRNIKSWYKDIYEFYQNNEY